jgi:hypothetical protein
MGVLQRPGDVEDVGAEEDREPKPVLKEVGDTGLFENQQGRMYDPMRQPIERGSAEEIEALRLAAQLRLQQAAPVVEAPPLTPNWYTPGGTLVRAGERVEAPTGYAPMTPPGYAAQPGAPILVGGAAQMLQPMMAPPMSMGHMVQAGGAQYIMPQPIVYQSPTPQTPTTIVIDTSPQAMEQSGYQESMQAAARGMPVMGSGQAGGRRHTTPRARAMSPRRGPASVGGYTAGAKITINKLG